MAVEDVDQFGRRPRIDPYGNVTYPVAHGRQPGFASPTDQVHVVDALRMS
ncbi:MAG TPA: hypothetical protein VK771_09890 [Acidimicrobiia bacterium]|nr:hypothetical protein [Acidimicrobiia bacterium]